MKNLLLALAIFTSVTSSFASEVCSFTSRSGWNGFKFVACTDKTIQSQIVKIGYGYRHPEAEQIIRVEKKTDVIKFLLENGYEVKSCGEEDLFIK